MWIILQKRIQKIPADLFAPIYSEQLFEDIVSLSWDLAEVVPPILDYYSLSFYHLWSISSYQYPYFHYNYIQLIFGKKQEVFIDFSINSLHFSSRIPYLSLISRLTTAGISLVENTFSMEILLDTLSLEEF